MKKENQTLFKEFLEVQAERTKGAKDLTFDPRFPAQNKFIHSHARFIDAQCSRRAGKSTGLAFRFLKTMKKYPGSTSLYLALTRESAQEIMWPVLQEIDTEFNLGCEFVESKLLMRFHNGAKLKLVGADQKNFTKRLKGKKHPAIGVDEVQDFGGHLESLVNDVLTPCMTDYEDSWLALTGTPGPVPQGYWFDVAKNNLYGYEHHEWDLTQNPYLPDPEGFIQDLCKRRSWDLNHPTLLREWRNKWVLDVESLWIRYNASINHFETLPQKKSEYTFLMGVDLGFRDADAISVLAWSESSPITYLVEELVTTKQGITELVKQIESLQKKYDVAKIVMDEGGLGKKIAEEIRRQKHIPVHQADKALKQQNAAFLNDALRLGHFKAGKNSRFAQDSYQVQIDWDKSKHDKIVVKAKPHSDIIDSVLYAFKESPAYAFQEPKTVPKKGTKEYAQIEQESFFDKAQEYFQRRKEDGD